MLSLVEMGDLVNATDAIAVCRDPKDNMILELAVSGKADVIVTGDDDLLVLNPFREIAILNPQEFLKRFLSG
jgi:putative PIN family toxin of toxin-antitoxin system